MQAGSGSGAAAIQSSSVNVARAFSLTKYIAADQKSCVWRSCGRSLIVIVIGLFPGNTAAIGVTQTRNDRFGGLPMKEIHLSSSGHLDGDISIPGRLACYGSLPTGEGSPGERRESHISI
jgi:hypothetical protein